MVPLNFSLDSNKPIGEQLVAEFSRLIAIGEWQPGARIPSVRSLAVSFGVNPNTVQKALTSLDDAGLLEAPSTSGRFVTNNEELIFSTADTIARDTAMNFALAMQSLNISRKRAIELFNSQAELLAEQQQIVM